jgi:2'-5' RNA ligase
MRLFVAVDIPEELKMALDSFLKPLRPAAKIAWSRPENLHITTQFIGEWPDDRLDEMKAALAAVPVDGAFDIAIKGIGWFPNARRPRVFWAGVDGGEPLRRLAHVTGQELAKLGVAIEERPYSPHLTLARMRDPVSLSAIHKALQAFPAGCGFDFGRFRANCFCLYRSAGGRYTQLAEFPLG